MESPQVRYAKSGDVRIAYQVYGKGPHDLVYGRSSISQLELVWDEPDVARFFAELGSFARVILWDKRGVGLSDRVVGTPTLEDRMDDVRAVMDAVNSSRAVLFGATDTAAMSLLFAATYPERTLGVIALSPLVRGLWAPDYPWVWKREQYEESFRLSEADWGSQAHIDRVTGRLAPSRAHDPAFKRWLGRVIRFGSSPSSDISLARMNMEIDVRAALPAVHVPTLVLKFAQDPFLRPENADYVASHVAGARLVTLPGPDHLAWANPEAFAAAIKVQREFIEGLPEESTDEDRVLLTVLFTDVVGSTRRAAELGDRAWAGLLDRYFAKARAEVSRFRGSLIKTTGDGTLATFDGPTRAVRCATALRDHAHDMGLETRSGLHTGECLLRGGDLQGIAVHIAARVSELANSGEVVVSATVRELSIGSDIRFSERRAETLRGVDGVWKTYLVEGLGRP